MAQTQRRTTVPRLAGIDHLGLTVPDVEACEAWYARVLGMTRLFVERHHQGTGYFSFYFKSPMHAAGLYPEHDLFIQLMKLKNTLRFLKGEDLITHLGREYYD
jgi:catechol 2,3-dioxygenase-like lactoylglutathione lyase family enzyme